MEQTRNQAIFAGLLVLFAMATRVLFNQLHVYNFNAVMAAGLFGGAFLGSRKIGIWIPIAAMLATDAVLGFYDLRLMLFVYAAFLAAVFIGKWYSKNSTLPRFTVSVIGGSLLFFFVTNGAVWLTSEGVIYPKTLAGLAACYAAGIPFYRNTLLGDMTWSVVLFGSYEVLKARATRRLVRVAA